MERIRSNFVNGTKRMPVRVTTTLDGSSIERTSVRSIAASRSCSFGVSTPTSADSAALNRGKSSAILRLALRR